jgi:hypothetical protein
MFNTTFLKESAEEIYVSRDIFPFSRSAKRKIRYYDHFYDDNGMEIIVLPAYISLENENILTQNNFTVLKNSRVPNEIGCFAYRKGNVDKTTHECNKIHDLVIMTLFYEETRDELQMFYDYYRSHGVQHFYMYYNGELNDTLDIPRESDITYIEWNYDYWYYEDDKKYHHAQIPAMISFYKKYLPKCEAALMIDTDEFLKVKGSLNINKFIKRKKKCGKNLFSSHHWAKLDREYNIVSCDKSEFARGKSIIYSDFCSIDFFPNVHMVSDALFFEDLTLLHNKKFP